MSTTPPTHNFEHLPLVLKSRGIARYPRVVVPENAVTAANRNNRATHSSGLAARSTALSADWKTRQLDRQQRGLPSAGTGIPLLLKIDPSLDLDDLRRQFDFEIVSEQEDGFVIVASDNVDLDSFQAQLTAFAANARGASNVAKIHELREDLTQDERLRLIFTDDVRSTWNTLDDARSYVFDVSITCIGNWDVPRQFRPRSNWSQETNNRHLQKRAAEIAEAYRKWDDLQYARSEDAKRIIRFYNGEVLGEFHGRPSGDQTIPDYFTLRVELSGKGARDLFLNVPFIFEVSEPDDIRTPQQIERELRALEANLVISAPPADAPKVCVIDGGIQEGHLLIEPGIDKTTSHCFVIGKAPTDIADYIKPSGHGTRVAGAVLHGESISTTGTVALESWVQNARVLDETGRMPEKMFAPSVLRQVITQFHRSGRGTRVFNHSINASAPCRTRHMSAWAAEIDLLSHDLDILVVQSAGNIALSNRDPNPGVEEHLAAGRQYPAYLAEGSSRIASPAQSFQALTVGSVAYGAFESSGWKSFAIDDGQPSAFSRAGLGIWGSIKPEVVEYGGDYLVSGTAPARVDYPAVGRECYPSLVRSTVHGGPAHDQDGVGTSFAAPKVSRIAARLQAILPDEPCLLYRALIVQSAQWPAWAQSLTRTEKGDVLKRIGYGIPDIDRACANTPYRTTFISSGAPAIGAKSCHVYQVPIPAELRRPGDEHDLRIDVTLSYVAAPRRTRRSARGYLATWLDWVSNGKDEPLETFMDRAMDTDNDAPPASGSLGWAIESRTNWGAVADARRNIGTVQKDWLIAKANALPENLCIAVRGHEGWNHDPESVARYTLAVTFEIVGQEIPIYEPLRAAILELQSQVEAEVETEIELQVEE